MYAVRPTLAVWPPACRRTYKDWITRFQRDALKIPRMRLARRRCRDSELFAAICAVQLFARHEAMEGGGRLLWPYDPA